MSLSLSLLSVGPHGTAICVYSAENTAPGGGTGRSQSMFDIFREDLEGMNGEVENNFIAVSEVKILIIIVFV